MSSFKQLRRLVDGVSLIGKEVARRSEVIESARNGDLQTLVASSLKKVLVSATDFSGLTKGMVREFSSPRPRESVVYFNDDNNIGRGLDSATAAAAGQEQLPVSGDIDNGESDGGDGLIVEEKVENVDRRIGLSGKLEKDGLVRENHPNSEDRGNGGGSEAEAVPPVVTTNRRKPREVKVPATPFSRALG